MGGWGAHVLAILGLAVLCGAWVALQLAGKGKGEDPAPGARGECGACACKRRD